LFYLSYSICHQEPRTFFLWLTWVIWGIFVADYATRIALTSDRRKFVRTNKLDLLVILLPVLRALRVVRSARWLRILRAARTSTYLGRAFGATSEVLTRHKLHYVLALTTAVVFVGALLVHALERDAANGNIETFGDALWWAAATVTTAGFGDRFPTTPGGRAVAVALMIVGISLFGFVAGSLVSYFFDDRDKDGEATLKDVIERLDRVEHLLQQQHKADNG